MADSDPNVLQCRACGTGLAASSAEGLCPRCLLMQGLEEDTDAAPHERWQPPTPETLASQFADIDVIELLGSGGMGAVYKARQRQLDRVVALKILPPAIGKDPAFAERFAREAKALARLNHPGIVTLYEFGQTGEGLYFFLMEYVDGVSLRHLEQTGRVAPREALAIVPQVCDALQYAHDQGVVHRDIKPENILIDRRGRVKVADFGLARMIASEESDRAFSITLTEAGRVMGTPRYMAPEQMNAPGQVDHRADIYALGVVFYQMLTGELPGKPFAPPSEKVAIDVRLDEVVLRALQKTPEKRYAQVSLMKTEIEAIAASEAVHAPPAKAILPGTADKKRYSKLVIYNAVWMIFGWIVLLGIWMLNSQVVGQLLMIGPPIVFFAGTATLIGWIAVARILVKRRRLRGIMLALCEAFFYPLVVISVILAGPVSTHRDKNLVPRTPATHYEPGYYIEGDPTPNALEHSNAMLRVRLAEAEVNTINKRAEYESNVGAFTRRELDMAIKQEEEIRNLLTNRLSNGDESRTSATQPAAPAGSTPRDADWHSTRQDGRAASSGSVSGSTTFTRIPLLVITLAATPFISILLFGVVAWLFMRRKPAVGADGRRISRLPILGAAWIVYGLLVVGGMVAFGIAMKPWTWSYSVVEDSAGHRTMVTYPATSENLNVFIVFGLPLLFFAFTATVIGGIALIRIWASNGKLRGKGLALFDVLFYPVAIVILLLLLA